MRSLDKRANVRGEKVGLSGYMCVGLLNFRLERGGIRYVWGWESSKLRKGRLGVSKLSHGELYHDPDGRGHWC